MPRSKLYIWEKWNVTFYLFCFSFVFIECNDSFVQMKTSLEVHNKDEEKAEPEQLCLKQSWVKCSSYWTQYPFHQSVLEVLRWKTIGKPMIYSNPLISHRKAEKWNYFNKAVEEVKDRQTGKKIQDPGPLVYAFPKEKAWVGHWTWQWHHDVWVLAQVAGRQEQQDLFCLLPALWAIIT